MRTWNDDPFTKRARKEDFAARSIYKLEEIDRREKILKGAKLILDLGAAPGSWSQYCLRTLPKAQIIAVDISPLEISDPRLVFLHEPIEEAGLTGAMGNRKADLVLSDMAPKTSGQASRDVALSLELANLALETARKHLSDGGSFVAKLFMGDGFEDFRGELRASFEKVSLLRPESTRKHSREIFFIAKNFRPLQ